MTHAALAGFLGFLGVLWPHFGHSFEFGLHNRVIGWVLLGLASIVALPGFRVSKANGRDLVLCLSVLALAAIYSNATQIAEIVQVPTRMFYYTEKLAVTFQCGVPVIASGFILSSLRARDDFWRGVGAAAVLAGILAMFVIVRERDLIIAQTVAQKSELVESGLFAATSFSSILSFAAITLFYAASRGQFLVAISCIGLAAPVLAGIVMVQQRSHLLFLAVIASVLFLSHGRLWNRAVVLVAAAGAGFVLYQVKDWIVGESVAAYWDRLMTGEPVSIRFDAMAFAIHGFLINPLGTGYGTFSLDYPSERIFYPHNIVLEALYELGIPGGIVVGVIVGKCFWRFAVTRTFAGALVAFATLHLMKSADLAGADMLWATFLWSRAAVKK